MKDLGLTGVLCSQIGYELNDPKKVILRSTDPKWIDINAVYEIVEVAAQKTVYKGEIKLWGEKWQSTWWIADFSAFNQVGKFYLLVKVGEKIICQSDCFEIDKSILFEKTYEKVALDQFEKRAEISRNQAGWKDCGADWREVTSHATAIIGLCEMLSKQYERFTKEQVERTMKQLIVGCDYICLCQDKAEVLGYPKGSAIHDIPNHMFVLPQEIPQIVVALTFASRLLTEFDLTRSTDYLSRAQTAYESFLNNEYQCIKTGFSCLNHGAPKDFKVPDEYMTRDYLMLMWGGFELWRSGRVKYKDEVCKIAEIVMSRQVPKEKSEDEFYGHFYTFSNSDFTEKANIHHHVGHDTGGIFPYYIMTFFDMLEKWYDHADAPLWRQFVLDFAYGYFLPACSKNPFYLLPEGYFKNEGLLSFCGPWHGINVTIAFASALATRLEDFTGDYAFREIAIGNLQWIAGLNSGISCDMLDSCFFWKPKIEQGKVLSYSQISGVGNRSVGTWTGIEGTIINGFSNNKQFQLEVEPTIENDGPWQYTDEDWIPHSGGYLVALSYVMTRKYFNK